MSKDNSKKNFFDRFKKPAATDKNKNNNNPIAGWFGNLNRPTTFSGTGQSLGGNRQPGQIISVEFSEPGPLGLQIERRTTTTPATAIVQRVVENSQAERAGIQRGDVLCFAGSNGTEEILYDMFVELAASDQRPLCLEVRRVPQTKAAGSKNNPATKSSATSSSATTAASAEAYARRQAVIAAAEKREREHKKKSKPLPKKDALPPIRSAAEVRQQEAERQQRLQDDQAKELSEATRQALQAAKSAEQQTAAELGYNPYETKSLSAATARNAVTATTHGSIDATAATGSAKSSGAPTSASQNSTNIPSVAAPPDLPADNDDGDSSIPPQEFQHAFETVVTSHPDHAAVVNSLTIMRKLIVNATTKGQNNEEEDAAAKFRKIRLANPKICAAVTDQPGAVDLLLSVGFELHSSDDDKDESVLVYPPACPAPAWLSRALRQMEGYVEQSKAAA